MYLIKFSFKKIAILTVIATSLFAGSVSAAGLSTNPSANFVIGQSDFVSNAPNTMPGGFTFEPTSIAIDQVHHRLFVADTNNQRVFVYDISSGPSNSMTPVHVLGQPDLNSNGGLSTITASNMQPEGLAYDSVHNRLFVADAARHRVLVFNTSAITDNMNAVHVIGQPDMFQGSCNQGGALNINTLCFKDDLRTIGLAYDSANDRLFVSDIQNQRVMVFDTATITDGEDASHVIGQPDFTTGGSSAGLNDQGFNYPYGMAFDTTNQLLYAASSVQNRVLVFNTTNLTDFPHAVHVLGQSDFMNNSSRTSANGFDTPSDVSLDETNHRLFVSDIGNGRVVVFNTATLTDGMDASYVIGQPNFSTGTPNSQGVEIPGPKGSSFLPCAQCVNGPIGSVYDTAMNTYYLADIGNNRILAYDFSTPVIPKVITYSGSFTETPANDGSVNGSHSATISGETFTHSGGTLIYGTDYAIINLPSGLSPTFSVNGSGTIATLTLSGKADNNTAIGSIPNLFVIFLGSAFTGSNAASVVGSSDNSASITFIDAPAVIPSTGSTGRYINYKPTSPTTPTPAASPNKVLGSGTCPKNLLINDLMQVRDQDGKKSIRSHKIINDVALLQGHINRILAANYHQAAGPIDGIFGSKTKQGVMRLQTALNTILKPAQPLVIDGIVGPYTKAAINNSCSAQ